MKKWIFAVLIAFAPSAVGDEFNLLLDAEGSGSLTLFKPMRLVDNGRYLSLNIGTLGFPAPYNEIARNRYWFLDLDTLELIPVGLVPIFTTGTPTNTLSLADGRYTAYVSTEGPDLDPAVPADHHGDLVYFVDLDSGDYTAISTFPDGSYPAWPSHTTRESRFARVAISPDARYIVYWSKLGGLAAGADPDPDIWNLFAYDRVTEVTMVLAGSSMPANRVTRTWFLPDGRLVASLPKDDGSGEIEPKIYATLGAGPVPLFDDLETGALVEHVSDDGRYAYGTDLDPELVDDVFYLSITNDRWRIDLNTGERVDTCVFSDCFTNNASTDGRYISFSGVNSERVLDMDTGQIIGSEMRHVQVAADGLSLYGFRDGRIYQRELRKVRFDPVVTVTRTDDQFGNYTVSNLEFDVAVTNTGAQTATVEFQLAVRRDGDNTTATVDFGTERECDHSYSRYHCWIDEFAQGEHWTAIATRDNAAAGEWALELEIKPLNHFFEDFSDAKTVATVEVPEPVLTNPPAPTPPPSSGGGGAFSYWWLLTLLIGGRYWDRTSDPCRVKAVLYR